MTDLRRILIAAATLIFVWASAPLPVATAQHRQRRHERKKQPRLSRAVRPAPVPPRSAASSAGKVWAEYDPLTFTTAVGFNFMPLAGVPLLTGKHISMSYDYAGKSFVMPDTVKLFLMEVVDKPQGDKGGEFRITVDGMELLTGRMRYLGVGEEVPSGVPEMYGARIPVAALAAMAKAN